MIEDSIIVSPKRTLSLVIFYFSGLSDYILKILILETVRGMQLNFFPFFLCLGSVTRPKVSYILKGMCTSLRECYADFCRTPGLRTVKKGTDPRESRSNLFSLYCIISCVQISYQYRVGF